MLAGFWGWGRPGGGSRVQSKQLQGSVVVPACSSSVLEQVGATVLIFIASSFHCVLHMLPAPPLKPQVYVEVTCRQLLSLLCLS